MVCTADGRFEIDKAIDIEIEKLGGMLAEVVVLPDTPSLLSAGMIEKTGSTSVWAHGCMPCLVDNSTGQIIVLDVKVNHAMLFDLVNDPQTLQRLSRVLVTEDFIRIPRLRIGDVKEGQIATVIEKERIAERKRSSVAPDRAMVVMEDGTDTTMDNKVDV